MSQPTIQVTVVDATGAQRTFDVGHVDLNCGSACIDIRAGRPAFCRGFERGVMMLDDGTNVRTLIIINGMASLKGNAVTVICESATEGKLDGGEDHMSPTSSQGIENEASSQALPLAQSIAPQSNKFPIQPTEAIANSKQQTANNTI